MQLSAWLSELKRTPNTYARFTVYDAEEIGQPSEEVIKYLISMLSASLLSPSLLTRVTKQLGWQDVQARILSKYAGTSLLVRHGDFGETLFVRMLEQFHGYHIPIMKLRYKVTPNQTLTGTDALALKIDTSGNVEEVCFIESKVRTGYDRAVAVEGRSQLTKDYNEVLPSILIFTSQRLQDLQNPLLDPFLSYLRSREDTREIDTFRLALCWDKDACRETSLQDLDSTDTEVSPLTVHMIRIHELRSLIAEVYNGLGIMGIEEDD